jgi:hypothetical protein
MSKEKLIKWVEPRIVNMEQLPTTLGACGAGSSAGGDGTNPSFQCRSGGRANQQCKTGTTVKT